MSGSCRLLGLGLVLVAVLLLAPRARADTEVMLWTTAQLNHPINEDWSVALWAQGRFTNRMTEADQFLVMPSLNYRVVPGVAIGLGYTYWVTRASDEVHLVQDLAFSNRLSGLRIGNRFRLEERFINNLDDMVLRGRYRLRFSHPIGDSSTHAIAANEIFANLNNDNDGEGPPHGYEQNRLFGGIGVRIGGHWRVEVGYEWRNFVRRGDADRRDDHIASLTFFYDTKGTN